MDFKKIDTTYSPHPVWLWNSKLNIDITTSTVEEMNSCFAGGFIVAPSCGLKSSYLADEWLRNVSAALENAADTSMNGWICNGFPSITSYKSTQISSKGLEFQQKFLRCEYGEKTNDRTIIFNNGFHFYYDVNPVCIDVFDKTAAVQFIENAYKPYVVAANNNLCGFLFAASEAPSSYIPWSFDFPAEYKNKYGEELLDALEELFRPVGNYKKTRQNFWNLVSELFEQNFLKPIYDWCTDNNLMLKGLFENELSSGFHAKSNMMTHYEYTHIPCVRESSALKPEPYKALMASSAMHQLGKKQSCALLFSSYGHSRSNQDFKRMAEQYLVRGVTNISPFAASYSLSGFRKTTVSTPVTYQDYRRAENQIFNNYFSRISRLIAEGKFEADTLLLHNMTDFYPDFNEESEIKARLDALNAAIATLEKKHIPFDIGDELLLKKHAYVEGDCLVIGKQKYRTIVLISGTDFLDSTTELLSKLEHGGGYITTTASLKNNPICDNDNLLYTVRCFADYKMHYFVNSSQESFTASISRGRYILDLSSGELKPFFGIYKFSPYESVVIIDDGLPQSARPYTKTQKTFDIKGDWKIESNTLNTLVIDKCDVYIDGELLYKDTNAYEVSEFLYKNNRPVDVECIYKFCLKSPETDIFLSFESFEKFTLKINSKVCPINLEKENKSDLFSKMNITQFLHDGENIISFSSRFSPDDKTSSQYEKASVYKTELNKFTYKLAFSPIYILGDFCVNCNGIFRQLDKNAVRYLGAFEIVKKQKECDISNIEQCGFPFFAGRMTLSKTINLSDTSYCIKFNPKMMRSVSVTVNGKIVNTILWSPFQYDISDFLEKGDNEIKLTFTTSLRNLFGPHHIPLGEIYDVTPSDYYKAPCIWNRNTQSPWEENYCFLEFGIDIPE